MITLPKSIIRWKYRSNCNFNFGPISDVLAQRGSWKCSPFVQRFSKCSFGYHFCIWKYDVLWVKKYFQMHLFSSKENNSFLNNIFFDSDLKEGMKDIEYGHNFRRGQMNWSKKSIWSNNNEVMFNVLGFECKPEEKICKNTGHFWEKD